jgi:hypothetical protein
MLRHLCIRSALLAAAVLLFSPAPRAHAAWPNNPTLNLPVGAATSYQRNARVIGDGAGGAFVVWDDQRDGVAKIFIQRLSPNGDALWGTNGEALTSGLGDATHPVLVSDGFDGAIVIWADTRVIPQVAYAQRVDGSGVPQWTADGVQIGSSVDNTLFTLEAISDGAHGAFAVWTAMTGTLRRAYTGRVTVAGSAPWGVAGVALGISTGAGTRPKAIPDVSGGEIVTWEDARAHTNFDIYAQKVNSAGAAVWTANGVALCTEETDQHTPVVAPDGSGGAIVAWVDNRDPSGNPVVFAQRVNSSGSVQWAADGVAIVDPTSLVSFAPVMASDGAGGAIVVWNDDRNGFEDLYGQRVDGSGAPLWGLSAMPICTGGGNAGFPALIADGAGGAIATWQDDRNGPADIYAQRINPDGTGAWTTDGVVVSIASSHQQLPAIGSDGNQGAIVAWQDQRSGLEDVYAQRLDRYGLLGGHAPLGVPLETGAAFALDPAWPNPSRGGDLVAHFALPNGAPAALELLDVTGRRVAAQDVGALGAGRHTVALNGARLSPGLYVMRLRQAGAVRTTRVAVLGGR